MPNRYKDWLKQAEADIKHARNAKKDGDYEWSCFAAHQAAEKALKAVLMYKGIDAWGHSLTVLLGNLESESSVPRGLEMCAKILDKHYIPTRYPNGFDSGSPVDYYTEEEAANAIEYADKILDYCRLQVSE